MPASGNPDERRRIAGRGRQLDPSRDAVILQAALERLAEVGYDRLSMEEIAARAHAGKGALYRRWPSKAALVVDVIAAWRQELGPFSSPDTGSLLSDLEAIIASVPLFDDADRHQMAVIAGVATAASRDPELMAAFSEHVLERPRRVLRQVLQRAAARGEISAARDLSLLPDILIALNLLRGIVGEVPDRDFVRRVLKDIIYPLVTAPEIRPGEHRPPPPRG